MDFLKNDLFPNIEDIKEKAKKELEVKVKLRKDKLFKEHGYQDPEANLFGQNVITKSSDQSCHNNNPLSWDITQDSYCFKCSKVKPARAHHCKQCKKFNLFLKIIFDFSNFGKMHSSHGSSLRLDRELCGNHEP